MAFPSDHMSRAWEDVEVGEVLPRLEFPISVKTLVLAACGTRDFMPYHHDPGYARSLGNRDMFVNTMFEQALFGRFAVDWSGPESDFRETSLRMLDTLCPGDVALVEGRVAEKRERGEDRLVRLELSCRNQLGACATATATLAMPSRARGPVAPLRELAKPAVPVDPELPEFARGWLGRETPRRPAAYPVSEVQILYWCDMVEDRNPLYSDPAYAAASRHGGIIAPPMALLTWAMARPGHQGVERDAPDVNVPGRGPWPPRGPDAGPGLPAPPGARETIAQGSTQTYGPPLRPGDRVSTSSEILNCSPLKQTRLGPGYFQTNLDTYFDQRGAIVGTNLFVLLRYGVAEG